MEITAGIYHALALLLSVAGIAKIIRPIGVNRALDRLHRPGWNALGRLPVARILGVAELAIAAGAIAMGGRLWAVALSLPVSGVHDGRLAAGRRPADRVRVLRRRGQRGRTLARLH